MKKNIQVVDGAPHGTLRIFAMDDVYFDKLFPNGTDVAFLADFPELRNDEGFWRQLSGPPVDKKTAQGIHGTLHVPGSPAHPIYFPNRLEKDARRYAVYMEPVWSWLDSHTVKCNVLMNGEPIVTVHFDAAEHTASIVEGGFSLVPHNPLNDFRRDIPFEQQQLSRLMDAAWRWAEEHPSGERGDGNE